MSSNIYDSVQKKLIPFAGNSKAEAGPLEDLEDVNISSPAGGQALVYDGTAEEWKNAPIDSTPTSGSANFVTSDGVYTALDGKVDKVTGKGLSTNDYDNTEKAKVASAITNAVNDLVNYYLKSETYSKTEVDDIVTAIKNSRFEVVATLPTTDIKTNVIYLVPKSPSQTSNVKDEYINLDGTTAGWEKIGDTEIDLSNYVTTQALNTALANYTTTANLTTLLAAKQDTLTFDNVPTENSNNPVKSNGIYVANRNIYEVMGKNGAKNKEPFDIDVAKALNTTGTWTGNSYELNGITFTFADDGKVTVSGTASALCSINISGNYDLNGDYIITGCPSGGGGSTYSLRIYDSSATLVADDVGEGISFTANNLANCRTNLIVRKDAAISTPIVFAPMIRDSKDTDPTYQPPTKTNQQLTDETTALLDNTEVNGAVNMLPNNAVDNFLNGVTFAVNSDGTVTVSGTATASAYDFVFASNLELPAGDYKLTGCPNGGSASTYRIQIYDGESGSLVLRAEDVGNGYTFSLSTTGKLLVRIGITNGTTISNLTFKPMISLASLNLSYGDYVPYAKSNRKLTEDTSSTIANIPNGAINLAKPNPAGTTTLGNVEFVIDSEGKVTANGTASANIRFDMAEVTLKAGKTYKICEPSSLQARRPFAPETYRCYARIKSSAVWVLQNNGWKGSYTPTEDVVVSVGIAMQSGNQVTDEIFAPMLVLDGTDVGDTFYPYAKTNRELTEDQYINVTNGVDVKFAQNFTTSYIWAVPEDGWYTLKLQNNTADTGYALTIGLSPYDNETANYIINVTRTVGQAYDFAYATLPLKKNTKIVYKYGNSSIQCQASAIRLYTNS